MNTQPKPNNTPAPPQPAGKLPSRHSSLTILLLTIVLVAAGGELGYTIVNISAMPVYVKAIGLSTRWVGALTLTFLIAEGVLKAPFGHLSDRIGRKPLIMAGPCLSMVTALLIPHVSNPWLLLLLRIMDGVGAAALWPASFSLISDRVPEARRAGAMSYFNLAYLMGVALGPLLGGYANDIAYLHFHMSLVQSKTMSFYLAALLFGLTIPVAAIALPGGRAVVMHENEEHIRFSAILDMISKIPVLLCITFMTFLGIGLITAYVKLFTMFTFHISEHTFGTLLLFPALFIGFLSIPLGTLSDKIGKALSVKIGIGMCALFYWILLLFPSLPSLVINGTLIGLGFVVAFPAWMAIVSLSGGETQKGTVIGAVGTAQGLGAICGVAISSLLYPLHSFRLRLMHHHSTSLAFKIPAHSLPFLACAIVLLTTFFLTLFYVHDPNTRNAAESQDAV